MHIAPPRNGRYKIVKAAPRENMIFAKGIDSITAVSIFDALREHDEY